MANPPSSSALHLFIHITLAPVGVLGDLTSPFPMEKPCTGRMFTRAFMCSLAVRSVCTFWVQPCRRGMTRSVCCIEV